MNPSGHCGRNGGYKQASSLHDKQRQSGSPAAGAPGTRGSFTQEGGCGYGQRPLRHRSPQHAAGLAPGVQPYDIGKAFGLLRTHPGKALDAAEVLLDKFSTHPRFFIRISQLKARALFQLGKIDDCIVFINSIETRVRNDKGLLMAKARALQARNCFNEALPLFQHLYARHTVAYKDHKTHGLALGRHLQLMGGADNLERALTIFTQLRSRTAAGQVNAACGDKEIELALGRHLQIMGGEDNLEKVLAIFARLRARHAGGRLNTPCDDKEIELALGRHLQLMGGMDNLQQALAIYTRLRTWRAGGRINTPCDDKDIELALGRHLQLMGGTDNLEKALAIFTRQRRREAAGRVNTPCDDKEIELAIGRLLVLMGGSDNLQQALAIYTRLRARAAGGKTNTPCNDKDIELRLGRLLQLMGGSDNLQQALTIFTRLRTRTAGGRVNTPCNDKDIELTLGRHLQLMGGADNLKQALAIFTHLRTWRAAGRINTPCDDKEIELALGRLFQTMGGADNLEKALTIYTKLRTRASRGQPDTACNDKEIELALGKLLELMGGSNNTEKALAIYTRLRTRATGGRTNTLCNDKDIELGLATLFIDQEMWQRFDDLRIEARRFPGFESHLLLSIRYFSELLITLKMSSGQSRRLGQAIQSAALAIEVSGLMNASCISQLAHCLRLLSCWPDVLLKECGIPQKDVRSLISAPKFLFDTADMIAPCRQWMEKDQRWRVKEQELLTLLARRHSARSL